MADLAIKGHPTRGMEVIQLLVMLGAKSQYTGTFKGFFYWIEDGQVTSSDVLPKNSIIFSLEEFEKKYPYKVGDNVTYYIGTILTKETRTIIRMQWDSDKCRILYYLDNFDVVEVEAILYRTECKIEQPKQKRIKNINSKNYNTATIKYIQENGSRDMELIIPHNQEIVNIDGRYILRDKKPQYPKTYKECCDVVNASPYVALVYDLFNGQTYSHDIDNLQIYENLRKLKICRDAYWKVTGEQMGLDKPWKYDMSKNEFSCAISYEYGSIQKCEVRYRNHFLVFPTAEMRDAFYENFKELINEVKELL